MMDFMLKHRPQPLPHPYCRAARRDALSLQVIIPEAAQYLHRLTMHFIEERQDVFITVGQFPRVSRITTRTEQSVFDEHISFDSAEMTYHIAEGEFSLFICPVNFFRRNARDDLQSPRSDFFSIVEKRSDAQYFHTRRIGRG